MLNKRDYFNLPFEASLILAIIPFTSWICGAVTRLTEGKILAGVVRLLFGFTIVWVLDIVYMLTYRKIFRLIEI
ncbi:MAG: hypothetical protein II988_02465 [Clostridia bacterium]|nr:hypothetical protein [Clostridia bacterium]